MSEMASTYDERKADHGARELGSVRMDSPRLKEIKEHDIQTHHAPHMEEAPWLAIPMKEARELLAGYDLTEDEKNNLPAMMAGYCRLLDESGMIFEGDSEREVQDAALDFCRSDTGSHRPSEPEASEGSVG